MLTQKEQEYMLELLREMRRRTGHLLPEPILLREADAASAEERVEDGIRRYIDQLYEDDKIFEKWGIVRVNDAADEETVKRFWQAAAFMHLYAIMKKRI